MSFRKAYVGTMKLKPCLHDRYEDGGSTKTEYFWQDLLVAQAIHAAKPVKHVDIGSRVDGFVAHVASFREVEVFDVRPISMKIPNVLFKQSDMMIADILPETIAGGYCDSLSCLHALEHFGLGRYGDPIDPNGSERGMANMAGLLEQGGTFYLSVPIGRERVEFNANWVFNPERILRIAASNGLALERLTIVGAGGHIEDVSIKPERIRELAKSTYNLGIFIFTKK